MHLDPPPATATGRRIGPFVLGRRLGGGGMGVVHEAYDPALGRSVALKLITPTLAGDPAFRARFTREAQAQARLDSAHVVHVYAHGEADGHLYLATQLVPDGDLGSMLQGQGVPPVRVAVDLVAQVAAGLADAHAAGLVHRDVKPANVLLRRGADGLTAYLADFGIARPVLAEPTQSTVGTVGTPGYMAPELHDGAPASVASDVYAVGCLLWTTLTGRAPYAGATDFQVATAHRQEPVPQLPGAGPQVDALNRVLRRAMAKLPGERHAGATALRDDLRAVLALPDTPVPLRATRASAGAAPHVAGWPVVVALVVLVVLVAAGLAVTAYAVAGGDDASSLAGGHRTATATPMPPSPSGVADDDAAHAAASLAAALEAEGLMSAQQAGCAARAWMEAAGLEEMAAAGFFDAQWDYVDQPQEQMSDDIRNAAAAAVAGCVAG